MLTLVLLILAGRASGSEILSRQSLALTIYNDEYAMVKDVRGIQFEQGSSLLYFTDVSRNIQAETVTLKPLNSTGSIRVLEQNFETNLMTKEAILSRSVNQSIDIVAQFGDKAKRINGRLLSFNGDFIVRTRNDGIVIASKVIAMELSALPPGLFSQPTLNWIVSSSTSQTTSCQISYRTTGFSWRADYLLTISQNGKRGDLGGWVTIDNRSGKRYENATLKLIAGDVNTVSSPRPSPFLITVKATANGVAPAPKFVEKSFADYHIYTLSRPVTLNDRSQKQVELIPKAHAVNLRSFVEINLNTGGISKNNLKVLSKVEFNNSAENGLGIAFPKGIFRAFARNPHDDDEVFIGEDTIDHTPKNENITLHLRNSFDVAAELQTEDRWSLGAAGEETRMNLILVNRRNNPISFQIVLSSEENVQLEWERGNRDELELMTASRYRLSGLLLSGETVVYKWTERQSPINV